MDTAARDPADEQTSSFLMHSYKVVPCSKRYRHDWSVCPFAHAGEMAARRDPKATLPYFCYHSKQASPPPGGSCRLPCPRGEACPYAHNLFEYWLHPSRYRTELCSFGMGCTRPVCFFAHNEGQLRDTGVPGGPQPVVAPPDAPLAGAPPPGRGGGGAGGARLQQEQLMLSGMGGGGGAPHGGYGGGGYGPHAASDVLPVLGAGAVPHAAMRGGGGGGGGSPPGGLAARAHQSMPLPQIDWRAALAAQQQQHQQLAAGGAPMFAGGAAGGGGPFDGAAFDGPPAGQPADVAAAYALIQAQLAARADSERRSRDLRRSVSEAAALAGSAPPAPRGPRHGVLGGPQAPAPLRRSLDGAALAAAALQAQALAQLNGGGGGGGGGAQDALMQELERQIASLQMAAASGGLPSGPLMPVGEYCSAPLPTLELAVALQAQQQQAQQRAAPRQHAAATAAALQGLSPPGGGGAPFDACTPPPARTPPLSPAPPGGGGGDASPLAARGADAFCRAPGGSRAASPSSGHSAGAPGAASPLMRVGDEPLHLDALQRQLPDAPPRRSSHGGDAPPSAPPPPGGAAAAKPTGGGAGGDAPMGVDAAAALLAQMPEGAVRDLLRVLASNQSAVSQPAA
ncbi:MAG: hypothetical protein J3K34DRAFT_523397 [Monoraphidium minutum]|nr:MAG: hypothetical protein J3K34DRAFT_523397 [Monoraphidium minutum]